MDLVLLVLGLAIIGFLVWVITIKIPMDPMIKLAIQIIVIILVVLYIIRRLNVNIPNIL